LRQDDTRLRRGGDEWVFERGDAIFPQPART
jgi:hypothetical protein